MVHQFMSRTIMIQATYLKRDEEWEPTNHVGGDMVHPVWMRAQADISIQDRLEPASKPMQHARLRDVEVQRCGASVVRVAPGQALWIERDIPPRVLELPHLLDTRATLPTHTTAVAADYSGRPEQDNVWRLGGLGGVAAVANFLMQFTAGHWREVSSVGCRDRYPIG